MNSPGQFPNLDNVQGNSLAGFLKDHQAFVFFAVQDRAAARSWVTTLADNYIATAAEVRAFNDLFKTLRRRDDQRPPPIKATWVNVAFTFAGLQALGMPPAVEASFEDDFKQPMSQVAQSKLRDTGVSDPANWAEPFRTASGIHMMLIVASDDENDVQGTVDRLSREAEENGLSQVGVESGNARSDEPGFEHFGFKDGVSQPRPQVAPNDDPSTDGTSPWQFVIGSVAPTPISPTPGQPGYVPPGPPPPAPAPTNDFLVEGSYVVFRKLQQLVQAFEAFANASTPGIASPEVFGAKLIGRYKSGAPLERITSLPNVDTTSGDPSHAHPEVLDNTHINDFVYANDTPGQLVPRAAHIRKTNIRQAAGTARRIMRRGIAYGASFSPNAGAGTPNAAEAERGLLFLCYQASVMNQFGFIQQTWANNADFPEAADGIDPIIGQNGQTSCPFSMPGATSSPFNIERFVQTRASAYLFSPSIAALKQIAKFAG